MVNIGDDMNENYMELRNESGGDIMNEVAVVPDAIKLDKQNEYEVYVGIARNLYWDESNNDLSIRGGATLSKYIKRKSTRKRPRLANILPPIMWLEDVPVLKYHHVWSICTDYNSDYFISSGKPQKNTGEGYRKSLKGAALKKGLVLSEQLIGAVFGPIDDELMKQYDEAKEFNYFGLKERK